MGKREDLLAYIERMEAEDETAKTYGDDWKLRDWRTRQSIAAGELCLAVGTLTRTEAKAKRRPKSIGARKAKRKAKDYRRKLKRLEAVLAENYGDYRATTPQYITHPNTAGYYPIVRRSIKRKEYKSPVYHVD